FFFQAEDGIRDPLVTGVQTCALPICGIEAEAAMLGQPTYLPWPVVVGVRLKGQLPIGTTATDLVLTLTELFRKKGVVNKFIEFRSEERRVGKECRARSTR